MWIKYWEISMQLELFNEIDLNNPRFRKTWCTNCGDKWGDENFLLGMCCGRELIYDYPMNPEEIKQELQRDIIINKTINRARRLKW